MGIKVSTGRIVGAMFPANQIGFVNAQMPPEVPKLQRSEVGMETYEGNLQQCSLSCKSLPRSRQLNFRSKLAIRSRIPLPKGHLREFGGLF